MKKRFFCVLSVCVAASVFGIVSNSNAGVIAAGAKHTCAIDQKSLVNCWGNNDSGQIGNGKQNDKASKYSTPQQTGYAYAAKSVETNADYTCALYTNGGVRCWGYSDFVPTAIKQNGNDIPDVASIAVGGLHACALQDTGKIVC